MPTYEYCCSNCSKEFELFQSISSDPFANCPQCGTSVRRSLSGGTGIIFKGSGFYSTDYKEKPAKKDSKKEATSSKTDKSTTKNKKGEDATSNKTSNPTKISTKTS